MTLPNRILEVCAVLADRHSGSAHQALGFLRLAGEFAENGDNNRCISPSVL